MNTEFLCFCLLGIFCCKKFAFRVLFLFYLSYTITFWIRIFQSIGIRFGTSSFTHFLHSICYFRARFWFSFYF
jgi:hypothetical protein